MPSYVRAGIRKCARIRALSESAVIERYRRREESVEEALIDMYLAGVWPMSNPCSKS